MNIEYVSELKKQEDTVDLYKALEWYQLSGYTDDDIQKANESFYSIYAYDGDRLVGLGRVASDGLIAAIMSGICVREDYRKRGIGAEIVRRLVEYCQSGIYKLNVQLFCEDSLIQWYEGMGFEKMPVGMRKTMPLNEEYCALKKNFGEIYGIEQITDLSEDFYWYNFDAFGDFSYYSAIGSEGVKVPLIRMMLYCNEPVRFSAEIIFENVSEFEIGCTGVRTPLFGFDIISTEKYGYSDKKRYKIRSLEDDDISFFCETFRVMSVTEPPNSARIAGRGNRSASDIAALAAGRDYSDGEDVYSEHGDSASYTDGDEQLVHNAAADYSYEYYDETMDVAHEDESVPMSQQELNMRLQSLLEAASDFDKLVGDLTEFNA